MTDDFLARIEAMAKARKMLALAAGNSNPGEAENAMRMAQTLATKHGFSLRELRPDAPMSQSEKMQNMRSMFGTVGGAIKKFAPGQDTEDYSKYREKSDGQDLDRPQGDDQRQRDK